MPLAAGRSPKAISHNIMRALLDRAKKEGVTVKHFVKAPRGHSKGTKEHHDKVWAHELAEARDVLAKARHYVIDFDRGGEKAEALYKQLATVERRMRAHATDSPVAARRDKAREYLEEIVSILTHKIGPASRAQLPGQKKGHASGKTEMMARVREALWDDLHSFNTLDYKGKLAALVGRRITGNAIPKDLHGTFVAPNGLRVRIEKATGAYAKHRIFAECDCGEWIPIGRFHQHLDSKAHGGVGVAAWRRKGRSGKFLTSEESRLLRSHGYSSGRTTHLVYPSGKAAKYTFCGERAYADTAVESVKDATCFYCKQAWKKGHDAEVRERKHRAGRAGGSKVTAKNYYVKAQRALSLLRSEGFDVEGPPTKTTFGFGEAYSFTAKHPGTPLLIVYVLTNSGEFHLSQRIGEFADHEAQRAVYALLRKKVK